MKEKILSGKYTFEEYLSDIHAEDYHGCDDDMADSLDDWIGSLDVSEVMEYAQNYADLIIRELK